MSSNVRSCSLKLGYPLNESSKINHGRLDTHNLTWDIDERDLKNAARLSWSPSYSSKPSMKKQNFTEAVAKLVKRTNACCNFFSDQYHLIPGIFSPRSKSKHPLSSSCGKT